MTQASRGFRATRWLILSALLAPGPATAQSALPADEPPDITLRLNLPAYRLEVFERGILSRSYRTAIGMKEYRTPIGSFQVSHLVWNPRWVPPSSPWAQGDTTMPPGPANPMGRVKLYFWPETFIHGTPELRSIGTAGSHSCVRLSNADAIDLAQLVLYYGRRSMLDSSWAVEDTLPRRIWLSKPVPLLISYDLAEVRDDRLRLYPDVYGFAPTWRQFIELAYQALAANGVSKDQVDPQRLNPWLDRARIRAVEVTVDSIRIGSKD
jgi:murein L,D-transpeptidase YcbB/YkuD